jgi:tetratricopeptide (TPR) repeat protein
MPIHNSPTHPTVDGVENSLPDEQTRLEDAMRRANDLLVSSLKSDERRRRRRRIIVISIGGLAMLAILCGLLMTLSVDDKKPSNETQTVAQAPATNVKSESAKAADAEKAAELSGEGWKLWGERNLEQASNKFEEAVKLDPENSNAWNGLGWATWQSGNSKRAIEAFNTLLKMEPKHGAALNGLGQLYLVERKYDEAEKNLLAAAPTAPAAWYGLAKVYLLKGKFDEAGKWAQKIVDSGDADGKKLLDAAKEKKLSSELRSLIEPVPPELGKAWVLMNQGRRPQAKKLFDELLAKYPNDSNVLNGLGWYYLYGSQLDEAKPYFEKAIKSDSQAAGSINGLARVLKAQGDVDTAIKLWEDMIQKFPGVNAGTYGLAEAYMEKSDYRKAIPLWEQIAKASPDDLQVKNMLERARKEAAASDKK